ncbi:single-stranded-DNA-specific exonuclease RecJ [Candidatus Woesebacteria bacterium]|nr:single-stranded-DNA-specific exonuclease RecJ [Candidatus Woesebacteria bacterium]
MEWRILSKIKDQRSKIKVNDVVGLLLENRGVKTEKEKEEFFEPIHPKDLSLKELGISEKENKKAIERIKKAINTDEKIIVYGDYDADGICGTAILWETVYGFHKDTLPYIPERFSEGYGLNIESISRLKSQNSKLGLIITVDHGIVADKKVDFANELGVDVIITDHHTVGKTKPKSFATIHTTKIGGAAVAWIFAREIKKKLQTSNGSARSPSGLELAAIGTIADQLPLVGPNRSFAKYGLQVLNSTKREGLLVLFDTAGIRKESIGTYEVNFVIAPRINAMGRMEHAIESLRLLCTKNRKKAKELALHLNKVNLDRQKVLEEIVLHALRQTQGKPPTGVIIVSHESYHEGVIGLAASRLVEEFYRPAIVLSKKGEIAKASARSIPGFNIIETIRKLDEFLIEGGGHPMAAGFSIETQKLEVFSRRLEEISQPLLTEELLTKKLRIDLEMEFSQINYELAEKVLEFEPTGIGNPTPAFATKGVQVLGARLIGSNGKHLKLKLRQESQDFSAIAFNMGNLFTQTGPGTNIDIAYNLEENIWNGNKNLELKIKDIKIIQPALPAGR